MDAVVKNFPRVDSKAEVTKIEPVERPTRDEAEAAARTLIAWIGDNPNREGLRETPRRLVEAFEEVFSGYRDKPEDVLDRTFGEIGNFDDLVVVRDIPFYSYCEHHMFPMVGRAHVAYFPVERVVGLSKIARVVDMYARRLQTQEHLTSRILSAIQENLKPRGVGVMIEAGTRFMPRFDEHGLISCIVVDAGDSEVLMFAHMNEEALARTIETGEGWFWSRSRKTLWQKGETSGNTLAIDEMRVDCDQDV